MKLKDAFKKIGVDSRDFRFGDIFTADDSKLSSAFKDKETLDWKTKPTRPVVVVSDNENNKNPLAPMVLVAPCSSSAMPTEFDVAIVRGEGGINEDSVVQLSLVQPQLKMSLAHKWGRLSLQTRDKLKTRIQQLFGIVDTYKA